MSLVEPDKKDPYGLAGRNRGRAPFLGPRVRRIRAKTPEWLRILKREGVNFAIDIWYAKDVAEAKKRARTRR